MAEEDFMKKNILLLLFCLISTNIFAFDLPIDILDLNYTDFMNKYEDEIKIENGYLTVDRKFEYFGTEIEYSISFNKQDNQDYFIFFNRPNKETEVFNEFYSDCLMHYANKSEFVQFYDDFDLSESQPIFNFFINGLKPICIYRKESMKNGFRGFGVVYGEGKKVENYTIMDCPTNFFKIDIEKLSMFSPSEITYSTIFINDDLVNDKFSCVLSKSDFVEGYFFKYTFLKKNQKYSIKIENYKNIESLKNIRIRSSNTYDSLPVRDIVESEDYSIKSENQPLYLVVVAKLVDGDEYGQKITIKPVE